VRTALTRTDRYSKGAIWFHWVIAVLVLLNIAIGLLHESLLDGVRAAIPLHKSIGMTVLVLTLGRIAWRLGHRPPPLPAAMGAGERVAAQAAHLALYLLLLALPLTGWLMISGTVRRRPFEWFGLADIPYLPVSPATGVVAHQAHGLLGYLMVALLLVHIGAALRHHLLLRDPVLRRMIPRLALRR
jgi:cytochrome b561